MKSEPTLRRLRREFREVVREKWLKSEVTYEITDPLHPQPIFNLIAERAGVPEDEMYEVFNMGCGFCVVVPESSAEAALESLNHFYDSARRIGHVSEGPAQVIRGS